MFQRDLCRAPGLSPLLDWKKDSPALEKGQNRRAACSSCSAATKEPEEDSLVGMGGENKHVCVVSCFILCLI